MQVDYKKEVKVPNGRIDILTDEYIIEAKYKTTRSSLFSAIGQLNYYKTFFPDRKLKIISGEVVFQQMINVIAEMEIEHEIIKGF